METCSLASLSHIKSEATGRAEVAKSIECLRQISQDRLGSLDFNKICDVDLVVILLDLLLYEDEEIILNAIQVLYGIFHQNEILLSQLETIDLIEGADPDSEVD